MRFSFNRWRTAALLGMLVLLAGCRTRAEWLSTRLPGTLAQPASSQTLTETTPAEASTSAEAVEESDDVPAAAPADSSDPVSLGTLSVATPELILEEAGVVIEYDSHQRPVGADLTSARVSAEVIRAVAELSELQWIDMRRARITDVDLAVLGSLPRLQLVALGETLISDAGLVHLQQHTDLRFVSLDRTGVSDAGILVLAGLPRLEGLSLLGTSVSRAGADAFESATPGCKVILSADAPLESPARRPPAPAAPLPEESTSQSRPVWNLDPSEPGRFDETRPVAPVGRRTGGTGETLSDVLQRKLLEPDVLQALAQHLMARQEFGKAARALEALVTLQPDAQQARFDLGVCLARSGDFDAAQRHLTMVVGEATALYNLGVIAYEQERPARSEWYFSRALEVSPTLVDAQAWLNHLRRSMPVQPAAHAPGPLDTRDLINLLMSEFESTGGDRSREHSGQGIRITPGTRHPQPVP